MKKYLIALLLLLSPVLAQATITNIVIEVPGDLDILDSTWQADNPGVVFELYRLDANWPAKITPGTVVDNGRKVIHASIDIDGDDPLVLIEGLLIVYALDWSVLHMQTFYSTVPAVWDTTDPENPVLVSPAQAFVYKQATLADISPYLQERHIYDEDGNIIDTLTKEFNWLHVWQGMASWVEN